MLSALWVGRIFQILSKFSLHRNGDKGKGLSTNCRGWTAVKCGQPRTAQASSGRWGVPSLIACAACNFVRTATLWNATKVNLPLSPPRWGGGKSPLLYSSHSIMQNFYLIQLDRKVGSDFVVFGAAFCIWRATRRRRWSTGNWVCVSNIVKYQFCISITLFVQNQFAFSPRLTKNGRLIELLASLMIKFR